MIERIRRQYGNLAIGKKIFLWFMILIAVSIFIVASNFYIDAAIVEPTHENLHNSMQEMLLAQQFSFEFEQMRAIEAQVPPQYLVYGYEGVLSLYNSTLPHLDTGLELLEELETERSNINTATRRAQIERIREVFTTYQVNIVDLVDGMLAHGDLDEGMGLEVIRPLEQINTVVDASEAIENATKYITLFDAQALLGFSDSMSELTATIQASDLPDEQQQELITLANASLDAFRALTTADAQIVERFMALDDLGIPVSTAIAEFIESETEKQAKAQERLDDAKALQTRLSIGLTVAVILLALGIAMIVSRSIAQPVIRLTDAANQITTGDYTQLITVKSTDEVGQLAQSFNEMASAVSARETQLINQAHQLRIATAHAKEAARLKGEFLANVSHELRTPLNAIIGYSDMLLMKIGGGLNENQEQKVQRLRENGVRLLNLINDILDLTRIEARRVELAAKPFAPRAMFARLTEQMEVLADDKDLIFEVNIAPDMPETLIGDEKRIEQIVINLLSNAFKFTHEGRVALSVEPNTDGETWKITVRDTGIGIPPHARDLVFEEFRQLDGTSTRAYKGTGLGLAITRNLVRMMDGKVTVESELGQGSLFTVTLPLAMGETMMVEPLEAEHVGSH